MKTVTLSDGRPRLIADNVRVADGIDVVTLDGLTMGENSLERRGRYDRKCGRK